LKNPFASSVAVMWRSSSCLVMCPTMPMCAPVARSGLFLAIVCNVLPSQALRITGDRVLPSRASTFSSHYLRELRLDDKPALLADRQLVLAGVGDLGDQPLAGAHPL
jgi:hypothetical protein